MKIKDFFSPNYNKNKRSKGSIKTIVIHYTGMQSARETLNKLCDSRSRVSCHYLITSNGNILRLVIDVPMSLSGSNSIFPCSVPHSL